MNLSQYLLYNLKENTKNLLKNETTIAEIINKLKASRNGGQVEVLSAKKININQGSKTANSKLRI